jgi:Ca-activated chloride channel family protein
MVSRTRIAALAVLAAASLLVTGCAASSKNNSAPGGGTAAQGKPGRPNAPSPAPPGRTDGSAQDNRVSPEVLAAQHPMSTFAMDVDTASYGYARRTLLDGRRPDPSTIRPEEFVNAFRQDYRQPTGNGFTVQVDGSRLPAGHRVGPGPAEGDAEGTDVRLMRVGLQTRAEDTTARADATLTFVIDVSGSMSEPGKLDMVKDALHTLVEQLRPTDAVAIVAFDDDAHTLREMTPVRNRSALSDAIDRLKPGGSTNLEGGLVQGYKVARAGFRQGTTNRVILLSDGLANVGDTEADPILRQVREEAEKQIALLGVGVGSDYGDRLMEQLADKGDGFVVYVSDLAQARRVFVQQLPATLAVRALDAKVQVTFDPATVLSYRLIGYDDRALSANQFRNDHVDGGEVGPGHSVTALYAVRLRGGTGRVAEARIRWQDPSTHEASELATTVTVADLARDFTAAAPRLRVCYAGAYFAEALRASRYGGEVRLTDLATIAGKAASATGDQDVSDLADLIRRADRLNG